MSEDKTVAIVSTVDDLLTDEQRDALTADLQRIAKQHRRGEDAAAQFVIGAGSGRSQQP